MLPESPLFREELQSAWADFDPDQAGQLLDELGLDKRDRDGVRLLPDGRRAEIVIETAGEDTEQVDVLELLHDTWLDVGIKIFTRPSQREVFRNRIFAGETQISIWSGLENGVPTADMSPEGLAPTRRHGLQWPKWGRYHETNGNAGEEPDMAPARELMELYDAWLKAATSDEREEIWHRMLAIHRDNVFSIGIIAGVMQPIVVNKRLRNVPREAVYNWDPGAQFGIYRPDTFWYEN